jgi:regulator of sigma E protease
MMLAATFWSQLGDWTSLAWRILEVLIGLGLVIFVHELGHFLVAKAVGIKVERFALGFGPRLLGFQRGETEYSIRALPLGGYVKMLGQDDFRPRKVIAQEDPRSYNAKPVWARLAVVSAGVIMNVLFALLLFVAIAMIGRDFPAPVVGGVKKHFPASEVRIAWHRGPTSRPATQPVVTRGLRTGDRVTRIEAEGTIASILGSEVKRFDHLAILSVMADPDETFRITVERDVDGNTWVGTGELGVRIGPSEMGGRRPSFGVAPADDTLIKRAGEAGKYITTKLLDPFEEDDRVVAVGGTRVRHEWEIEPILRRLHGATVEVTVLRGGKELTLRAPRALQLKARTIYLDDGTKLDSEDYEIKQDKREDPLVLTSYVDGGKKTYERKKVIWGYSDELLDLLGMVPRLLATGIAKDSGAERAGVKPGDVIVHYGDTALPTIRQLRRINNTVRGEGTHVVVERAGRRLDAAKITPDESKERDRWVIGVYQHVDLASTVVADVRPGSPAAKAGIRGGYVIDRVNDTPVRTWLEVFDALEALAGEEVTLTYRRSDRPEAEPATVALGRLDRDAFDPEDYEFTILPGPQRYFPRLLVTLRKEGLGEAIGWSVRETGVFIVTTYAGFRSLFRGTVSRKDIIGPIGMGGVAVEAAREDFMHLVYFLGLLSAILAVINFLPLPVVDGGHAVFLIIEKIRGRPIPLKVMNVIQMVGLVLIALVFLAVTYQDIMRLFG